MGEDLQQTKNMTHTLSLWCGGLMLAIGGLYYFFVHRQMKHVDGAPLPPEKQ